MQNISIDSFPCFQGLLKGLQENFNRNNFYVYRSMPEKLQSDYDGRGRGTIFELSEEAREKMAKENLLHDNGDWFDEFIHEDKLRGDVTEFMRDIAKFLFEKGAI